MTPVIAHHSILRTGRVSCLSSESHGRAGSTTLNKHFHVVTRILKIVVESGTLAGAQQVRRRADSQTRRRIGAQTRRHTFTCEDINIRTSWNLSVLYSPVGSLGLQTMEETMDET